MRTIVLSSHITVQGQFVRDVAPGRIAVRVGRQIFEGTPVNA